MLDLQRERGMSAACRDRGRGGTGRAGVVLQTDASRAPSSPHRLLMQKAESPKYRREAVAAFPVLPFPRAALPPTPAAAPAGCWRIAGLPETAASGAEAHWLSLARGIQTPGQGGACPRVRT